MDESSVTVVLREFDPEHDQALIYSTWRNAAYYGAIERPEDSDKFFKSMTKHIKETLYHAQVHIACLEDDPSTIIGYSVRTGTNLEFVYVKVDFRSRGIATMLCRGIKTTSSQHLTKIGKVIVEKKGLVCQD